MTEGRKADIKLLGVVILALIVFFILIGYTDIFAGTIRKGSDVEICRLSVLAQAKTKFIGSSPIKLECPRRQVKFFNNGVEINGRKDPKYEFRELSNDAVNKAVAEEMRLCWYMMGEGKFNVFEQNPLAGSEKVCTICSEMEFDSSVDKKTEFGGFLDYIKGTKMPGADIYYYDYLVKSQGKFFELVFLKYFTSSGGTTNKIGVDKFEPARDYITYFYAFKPPAADELLEYLGGPSHNLYFIGINTPQNVVADCKTLVN